MKSFHNIEKSAFQKGLYIGYSDAGNYSIRKSAHGGWNAFIVKDFAGNTGEWSIHTANLAEMSKKLEQIKRTA